MRKSKNISQNKKDEKRINEAIIAKEITVISEIGEVLGKMSVDKALSIAESRDLDLVEM